MVLHIKAQLKSAKSRWLLDAALFSLIVLAFIGCRDLIKINEHTCRGLIIVGSQDVNVSACSQEDSNDVSLSDLNGKHGET